MVLDQDIAATAQAEASPSDGLQQQPCEGRSELWHFDARLDDGTSVGIAFCLVGIDPDDPERVQIGGQRHAHRCPR